MKAPIVLFVYNRPEHTRQTIEALCKADGAAETELYVYSDGAKPSSKESVEEVRDIIRNIKGFASISIIERESNIGLAENIISGVSEVFKKHEKAIVLEDDLKVSKYFLTYMNSALEFYKNKGVFSVSGYTPNVNIPKDYPFTTYMINRNCSWGWGTWREKWEKVDWDVKTFGKFIRNKQQTKTFDQSGSDLTAMLLRYMTGEIHSWSIRFCYSAFCLNEPTVYPIHSLIDNNGVDGSGTNMKQSLKYNTDITDYLDCTKFADIKNIHPQILSSFKRTYDCSMLRRAINALKRVRYIINHPHKI